MAINVKCILVYYLKLEMNYIHCQRVVRVMVTKSKILDEKQGVMNLHYEKNVNAFYGHSSSFSLT